MSAFRGLAMTIPHDCHCEERSDEAISFSKEKNLPVSKFDILSRKI